MPRWSLVVLLLVMGCEYAAKPPVASPPPEDLSTWSVPELVQPPAPPTPAPADDKLLPGEKVYAFAPGTTFTATVPMGWPLDILLERANRCATLWGATATRQKAPRPRGGRSRRARTGLETRSDRMCL